MASTPVTAERDNRSFHSRAAVGNARTAQAAMGADGDPTAFLTDDALAELVGEALAPGAGAAMVTPEASPGVTPCGCRIQPTQFFQ